MEGVFVFAQKFKQQIMHGIDTDGSSYLLRRMMPE
jgi:hypothetical protein